VHGEEFAQKCIENIKQKGFISPVVRYFGLHYLANVMPVNNPGYLKTLEEAGFDWMKEFKGG
jgi:hypothetical protein